MQPIYVLRFAHFSLDDTPRAPGELFGFPHLAFSSCLILLGVICSSVISLRFRHESHVVVCVADISTSS